MILHTVRISVFLAGDFSTYFWHFYYAMHTLLPIYATQKQTDEFSPYAHDANLAPAHDAKGDRIPRYRQGFQSGCFLCLRRYGGYDAPPVSSRNDLPTPGGANIQFVR